MKTKNKVVAILLSAILISISGPLFAHCDSYDGPVIKDALSALQNNNVTLILKWVDPKDEKEMVDLFNKTYALRSGDKEIYDIVEKHFLETLVRLHRESEGQPFTGLKAAGNTPAIIKLTDNALEMENVDDLLSKLDAHIESVVREKYDRVIMLEKTKDENLEDGREYVEAYVDYTHTLEAIHSILVSGAGHHGH